MKLAQINRICMCKIHIINFAQFFFFLIEVSNTELLRPLMCLGSSLGFQLISSFMFTSPFLIVNWVLSNGILIHVISN